MDDAFYDMQYRTAKVEYWNPRTGLPGLLQIDLTNAPPEILYYFRLLHEWQHTQNELIARNDSNPPSFGPISS